MRQMPRYAQLYLLLSYVVGLLSFVWLVQDVRHVSVEDVLLAVGLALLAGVAQAFPVARSKGNYSDHLTPAPVFAALLLLPSPLLALVVAFTFVPEWFKFRRPWFIQLFNIATWMVAAVAGRWTLEYLSGYS